jgi:hypothetical protein
MPGSEAALGLDAPRMQKAFKRVLAAAREAKLPGLEVGTSYGTPALKVGGKSFMRMKDADTMVLLGPMEEKEMLLAAEPAIYFETDHYKGWPAWLVRLSKIGDAELKLRLERAWRHKATKRLIAAFEGKVPAAKPKPALRAVRKS